MNRQITIISDHADAEAERLRADLARRFGEGDPAAPEVRVRVIGPEARAGALDEGVFAATVRGAKGPPERLAIELRERFWDHDVRLLARQLGVYAPDLQSFPQPAAVKAAPLTGEDLDRGLVALGGGWQRVVSPLPEDPSQQRVELHRELKFRSFRGAIAFMEMVAPGCDVLKHHPRWENSYKTIAVYLSTHSLGDRISDRDIALARYVDCAYADYEGAA